MPTDTNHNLISLAILFAALFCPRLTHAQTQSPAPSTPPPNKLDQLRTLSRDELDIIKVLTQQERAWNEGDFDAFAKGFKESPDDIFISNEVRKGFDDMLLSYKKNFPTRDAMGQLSYSELEPHVLDAKIAVVVGKYHLERSKKLGGNADGIFSDIFEKTDKGWKIIINHTN
jgi:Domain of unknown function (DUF4440)